MKKSHIYLAIAYVLAATACSDDYFNNDVEAEYSEYIAFDIDVAGSDQFMARSTDAVGAQGSRRLTIDPIGASIGGRPLYLHTEVVDSIPSAFSRAKIGGNDTRSRGSITDNDNLTEICLSAVVFDGEESDWPAGDNSLTAQMYMHNEIISAPDWNTNRYWPKESDWIRFFAYAPCDALDAVDVDNAKGLPAISTAEPSFSYTIADNIPEQVDLLVGSEQYTGWKCETAPLDMGHALTAVKIHIDGNVCDFTLTSLKISGLHNSGTYSFNYNEAVKSDLDKDTPTHDAGAWSDLGGDAAYTIYNDDAGMPLTKIENDGNGNSLIDETTGKSLGYTDMTAGNMVLFMMPQKLSEKTTITITGKDNVLNEEVELSAVIGGGTKEWVKGNLYTYTLSFSSTKIEYHLEVTPEKTRIPFYGAKAAYTVKSYKTVTRSGLASFNVEVPWTVYDITDGTEKSVPDWFIMDAVEGSGNVSVLTYNYSVIPNLDATTSQSHLNLTGNAHKGSVDDPYNLSNNQLYSVNATPENTANCYIVSAPGYYTFPLIYGNAVTNGMVMNNSFTGIDVVNSEEQAYVTEAEGENMTNLATATVNTLKAFKDHANNDITQQWISSSRGGKYTPASAEIVWQDEPCLVTEVDLNDDNDYITFRVREDCICEGNAIIAVKDANGDIMWSWHIWVSDGRNYYDNGSGSFVYYPSEADPNTFVTRPHESRRPNSKWVDYDYTAATETPTPGSYTESLFYMMPAHIGHCDGESKSYPERSLKLRFKQYEADDVEYAGTLDAPKEFVFTQDEGNVSTVDNIPYYQYGRKDPMLPTMTETGADKYHYFNDWTQGTKINVGEGQASISDAIKNPGTYYHNTGSRSYNSTTYVQYNNWCSDGPYINLWNSSANILPMFSYHLTVTTAEFHEKFNSIIECGVTKTIYDPCPPGFELPRIDAFAGATYSGINIWPFHYNYDSDYVELTDVNDYIYEDGKYALHKQVNVWLPGGTLDGLTSHNGLSLYNNLMDKVASPGGGLPLFVQFFGHRRGDNATVAEYGNYAAALTCTPICMQWQKNDVDMLYFQYHLMRLCIIKESFSLRSASSSDFDLAFGIMPAKTGGNPSTSSISGDTNWSGDHSDIEVGF